METVRRFFHAPTESCFLFGPRGTGKSTLVRDRWPTALVVDLLDAEVYRAYAAAPERLRERLLAEPERRVVIIDEVQRAPALLSVVHGLIEEKRGWQFILTGSSARKLKRTGVDLLAGRALWTTLHPFMAAELGNRFTLARALQQGVPVIGYCYWSLLDNFEWADGFGPRFGLVEVDYATQRRTIRDSARRYAELCRANRVEIGDSH